MEILWRIIEAAAETLDKLLEPKPWYVVEHSTCRHNTSPIKFANAPRYDISQFQGANKLKFTDESTNRPVSVFFAAYVDKADARKAYEAIELHPMATHLPSLGVEIPADAALERKVLWEVTGHRNDLVKLINTKENWRGEPKAIDSVPSRFGWSMYKMEP